MGPRLREFTSWLPPSAAISSSQGPTLQSHVLYSLRGLFKISAFSKSIQHFSPTLPHSVNVSFQTSLPPLIPPARRARGGRPPRRAPRQVEAPPGAPRGRRRHPRPDDRRGDARHGLRIRRRRRRQRPVRRTRAPPAGGRRGAEAAPEEVGGGGRAEEAGLGGRLPPLLGVGRFQQGKKGLLF